MTIRVAHVNVARGYRGGERQTELLIEGLRGGDVHQLLVARRGQPLAERVGRLGIDIRAVSGNPLSVAAATGGVDLLHVHEGRSVLGAYLRARVSRTPYVVTRRVDNPIRDHWLTHRAYRSAACVVGVAQGVVDVLTRYDPLIRSRVIRSGSSGLEVDPRGVASIRGTFVGKWLVGHVAALDNRQKGQEHIIRVAKELQRAYRDIHFVLVGGGKDEAWLRAAAEGLENLSFAGFVENVGDYLAAFDVFILPSNKEGIGSILLDAMERGLPVIASRVGGVAEIVTDGENGILINPARPDQLKAAILRLFEAPELCRELGERGRGVAKAYTAPLMCERYLELYRSVTGSGE